MSCSLLERHCTNLGLHKRELGVPRLELKSTAHAKMQWYNRWTSLWYLGNFTSSNLECSSIAIEYLQRCNSACV